MNNSAFAQLGVSGVIVVILLYILKELWADNKELRQQMYEDQKAMLPALTQAAAATTAAMTEIAKITARYERR